MNGVGWGEEEEEGIDGGRGILPGVDTLLANAAQPSVTPEVTSCYLPLPPNNCLGRCTVIVVEGRKD